MDRKMSEQRLNIEFVKEVEKYPCIYDYRRSDYSRKEIIDMAWATIGEKINLSGPQCRERWKNLRTVLSRNLRPHEKNGRSRNLKQQRKPYYLFEAMKFAVPFIKSHNTVPVYFLPRDSSNSSSDKDSKAEDNQDEEKDIKEAVCHIKVEVSDCNNSRSPSPQYSTPPLSPQINLLEAPSPETPSPPPLLEPRRILRKRKGSNDTAEMEPEEHTVKKIKKKSKPEKIKPDLTKISKKRFLLSLLSDVYSMDNTQMRSFRIKVLDLVNEITQTPSTSTETTLCLKCQSNTATVSQAPETQPSEIINTPIELNSVFFPQVAVKIEKGDDGPELTSNQ